MTQKPLPLAQTEEQLELWRSLKPVNRAAATDTYKRTMSSSGQVFANNFAVYTLAARRGFSEDLSEEDKEFGEAMQASGRLIMAGLEKMLYPWFMEPVTEDEVDRAREFFTKRAAVRAFPEKAWQAVLDNDGYFPIDIYALPGGQTFLFDAREGRHVPIMSVEGIGALVSHLEPHFENMYAPIIHATKAMLMHTATGPQFAEFGLRSDQNLNNHVSLMLALYIGGGFKLTSDDQAEYLFPDYFRSIGTIGHEFVMAYQREGLSLEEAQEKAFDDFVAANQRSALLPDTLDTIGSGLPAILKQVLKNQGNGRVIMPRFDSGNIIEQCIEWKRMTLAAGIKNVQMVVEDGYTPERASITKSSYQAAGFDPDDILVGAGGYFQEGCTRDRISFAYKRSATEHEGKLEASLKFSDSSGKNSLPGQLRVFGHGNTLIVAQAGEDVDGVPLMQKVVDNGRIVYDESLEAQRQRALETWNKYIFIEYSPGTRAIISARLKEKEASQQRLAAR